MPRRVRSRKPELHPGIPVVLALLVWLVAEAGYVRCLERRLGGQALECHGALRFEPKPEAGR